MAAFLVYFLTDEVDDAIAARVADRVRVLASGRRWAGDLPGFFDSAEDGDGAERTTGGYLKVDEALPADAVAMWEEIVGVSRELGCGVEVQYREEVLGRVYCGEPDEGLSEAFVARVA